MRATVVFPRLVVGCHRGAVADAVAYRCQGLSLASAYQWCTDAVCGREPDGLPSEAQQVSTMSPEVNRVAIPAWVMANTVSRHIELWVPELCPWHENGSSTRGQPCRTLPSGHVAHRVEGCSCWCVGQSSARTVLRVSTAAAGKLPAAVRSVFASPEPRRTPMDSVIDALAAIEGYPAAAVEVWSALVAEGMEPRRAARASLRLVDRPPLYWGT